MRSVTKRLELSEFKNDAGLCWPRRWRVRVGKNVDEDIKLGWFKINPKVSMQRFDVGR